MIHQFEQPPVIDAWKSLARKRIDQKQQNLRSLDPDDPPDEMYDVLNFFEYVGLLAKRGYLDTTDVWDQFGYSMFHFYADARPVIDKEQKDNKVMFTNFSSLMSDLRQIEIRQTGGILDHPSPDEIYGFYATEAEVQPGLAIQGHRRRK